MIIIIVSSIFFVDFSATVQKYIINLYLGVPNRLNNLKTPKIVCIIIEFVCKKVCSSILFCNFTARKKEYIMKKNLFRFILILAAIASAVTACVRDKFQYSGYENQLEGYFPVDSIQKGHTWNLIKSCTNLVKGQVPNATKLMILADDPLTTTNVEVLTEVSTSSNISRQVYYIAPEAQTTIYVAVLNADGMYLRLMKSSISKETIELDSKVPTGVIHNIVPQEISYCYVANYPNPGDSWDYNDVVLTMKKRKTSDTTIEVDVTLKAVGFLQQIGAAIRWVGKKYDDVIDMVERDEETNLMDDPDRTRLFFSGEWTDFQKSRSGEFVINLFDDAHAAIYQSPDGNVVRRYFNTMKENGSTSAKASAKTVTYIFTFNSEYDARLFSLAEFDPFIIVRYGQSGSNFWEVHTYPYKLDEVLYPYYNGAAASYDNGFSWAVAIPYAKFRYPVEGMPIGELKKSIVAGAYQEKGHAFGEWILNEDDAQDWYLYPADGGVY